MIQPELLLQTIRRILDNAVPRNLNADSIADQLNALERSYNTALSEYGYVMYVLEHAGLSGIYHGRLSDASLMSAYAKEACRYRDDLPTLVVNAKAYSERIFSVIQDPDLCMSRLEGMSFPHVIYILFAATGHPDMAEQYQTETKELLARYPGTLDLLPESFQTAVKEAISADI